MGQLFIVFAKMTCAIVGLLRNVSFFLWPMGKTFAVSKINFFPKNYLDGILGFGVKTLF